jgi:hypothetical protein
VKQTFGRRWLTREGVQSPPRSCSLVRGGRVFVQKPWRRSDKACLVTGLPLRSLAQESFKSHPTVSLDFLHGKAATAECEWCRDARFERCG